MNSDVGKLVIVLLELFDFFSYVKSAFSGSRFWKRVIVLLAAFRFFSLLNRRLANRNVWKRVVNAFDFSFCKIGV